MIAPGGGQPKARHFCRERNYSNSAGGLLKGPKPVASLPVSTGRASIPSVNGQNHDDHPWPAEAKRLAEQAREEHGADWAMIPTWLLRSQWLRRLDERVTVLLVAMSTVVTPEGEMVISERELANRLMWRFDVLQRVLSEAEDHRLIERVHLSALPTEITWRLAWVHQQSEALHG